MSQRREFRVRWKREGRGQTTKIYQTWNAAARKAQGILALDDVKAETSFHAMPDLEVRPVIEVRSVGEWETNGPDQIDEATEPTKQSMREWAESYWPASTTRTPEQASTFADDLPF